MIKVILVEDQRLFREGTELLINNTDDIKVVGMAGNGEEAINLLKKEKPDVVLMDIHMPGMDGIKTTVYLKENHPDVKVVMLTSAADEELVIRGINVGADGFLLKNLYHDNLIQAIRNAYRGQSVLSGEVAEILVNKIRKLTLDQKQILGRRLENRGIQLTKRELDIAYLFMDGYTNTMIAQKLFLGEGTIKNYVSEIYNKLNIRHRKDAISYLRQLLKQ
ncbi:response regulator [Virgibacillus kekensis]|uniref:Response regulator n=1 Tax=Virgibacillus kekensis TaxID=202261 RepID=A0ABV9DIJ6_9BACI